MGDKRKKSCFSAEDNECVTVTRTAQSGKVFLSCDTVFLGKWFGVFRKHCDLLKSLLTQGLSVVS
jgi:hypothetical protein